MKICFVFFLACVLQANIPFTKATNYTRKAGYCMWYGQCATNPSTNQPLNCLYNNPAKVVDGNKSIAILSELCPEFAHKNSKVCCDYSQLVSLQSGMSSANQMMSRCPACWKNFRELYCRMTCSPNNSLFLDPVTFSVNKSILSIDFYVEKAFRDGMYNSCKNVVFPSNNAKIMSFMCGTKASECTPLKFLRFMGDPDRNGVSPFKISYPTTKPKNGTRPLYVAVKLCNESVSEPGTNSTNPPCSCQDCIEACEPLPPYVPTSHWELDVGDIHLNVISFATLLVYLAFLVLFIAFSILYYNISSRPDTTSHEYSTTSLGGRQKISSLLMRLGKKTDERIKHVFTRWGCICCNYSIFVIIAALAVVAGCSVGLTKFTVVTDPVKLWSAPGSQARQEKDAFDSNFSPFYRTAQIIFSLKRGSKLNNRTCYRNFFTTPNTCILTGNILRLEILHKILAVQTYLINMKVEYGSENVTLEDICMKPMAPQNNNCTVMSVLQYWQNDAKKLNKCIQALGKGEGCQPGNPIGAAWGDHLEKCADNPTSTNDTTVLGLPCTSLFGGPVAPSIAFGGYPGKDYSKAKVLIVTIIIKNHLDDSKNDRAKAWEKKFIEYMKKYHDHDLDVAFRAERSIEDEIERESHADIYTIIVSYVIMFLYITIALGQINQCERIMIDSKFSLAFGGILIVIFSVLSSLGIFSYFQQPATLIIIEVVPFLVLAVGVDNIFILVQKYQRDIRLHGETVEHQIGRVLGEVAPSMLLTSTSEAVAFAFGALSSMPAVKIFSLYASVAVFVNFLLQVTCFVALMSWDVRRQQGERLDVLCCIQNLKIARRRNSPSLLYQFFDKLLSPALLSKYVRPVVIVLFTTILALSIMVIPSIEVGLDQSLSMPKDSYMITYFKMESENLKVGPPVYFIVDNPKYPYQLTEWQNKICGGAGCDDDSLTALAYNAYRRSNQTKIGMTLSSWLDDYFSWASPSGKYPCCRILDYTVNKTGQRVPAAPGTFCNASLRESCYHCHSCLTSKQLNQRPNTTQFSKYLRFFLNDNPNVNCTKGGHAAYGDAVILYPNSSKETSKNESPVKISRFMGYHTILKTSADYIDALKNARKLAKEMSTKTDSHVFAYSIFYVYYEQYLTIVHDSWVNLVVCLASIFAVTFLLMGFQFLIAFIVTFTVAMIVTDIMGLMYLWSIPLNAISLVNLVMAVGISVEFCSHIARHFATSPGKDRTTRAKLALAHMGSSVFSGITLTKFGGILVLAFSASQIFQVFYFRMYLGIVLFGASHGLLFLPVFLSYIGPDCHRDDDTSVDIQESSSDLQSERNPLLRDQDRENSSGNINHSDYGTQKR